MKNISLAVVAGRTLVALSIFAGGFTFSALGINKASAQKPFSANIPKAWGSVKGSLADSFIFEDGSGVIRLVKQSDGSLFYTYTRN